MRCFIHRGFAILVLTTYLQNVIGRALAEKVVKGIETKKSSTNNHNHSPVCTFYIEPEPLNSQILAVDAFNIFLFAVEFTSSVQKRRAVRALYRKRQHHANCRVRRARLLSSSNSTNDRVDLSTPTCNQIILRLLPPWDQLGVEIWDL